MPTAYVDPDAARELRRLRMVRSRYLPRAEVAMPLKYRVSFDGPVSRDHTQRITRSNEMDAREAAEDVAHLRRLGYTGIEVVPVRASTRARAHGRRIHTAAFDARVAAIEASEAQSGRTGNAYAIATAQFEREGRRIFRRRSRGRVS